MSSSGEVSLSPAHMNSPKVEVARSLEFTSPPEAPPQPSIESSQTSSRLGHDALGARKTVPAQANEGSPQSPKTACAWRA